MFFTTSGTPSGDQQTSYTQTQLARAYEILAACSGFEGVAPGYLNELACSDGGANTVDVATGGAVVDGIIYRNSATVNANIPSAVGAGNTRIDRVVVRVTWASFEAEITVISGTDAASPTAPAITQTSGTTYDIKLCQALVDTSGNITVTDERTFAATATSGIEDSAVTTAKIADDNVTTAKIADSNVTQVKLATGASKLTSRQGGSATDWSTAGTTGYTPTTVRMQAGVAQASLGTSDLFDNVPITFPAAFSQPPILITGLEYVSGTIAGDILCSFENLTASGVTLSISRETTGAALVMNIHWHAEGAE